MASQLNSLSDNSVNGISSAAGNSTIGRVEHVQQVPPGRHQATISNRKTLTLGTWSVQTMLQEGKPENIKQEMRRMKLNILGLSEMRWKGAGRITSEEFTLLYSGGDYHHRGVGIVMNSECSKELKGFWCVNYRVIVVKISGKPFDIRIIQ